MAEDLVQYEDDTEADADTETVDTVKPCAPPQSTFLWDDI